MLGMLGMLWGVKRGVFQIRGNVLFGSLTATEGNDYSRMGISLASLPVPISRQRTDSANE